MLGLEIKPVWKSKKKDAKNETAEQTPALTTEDYVAIGNEAAHRLLVKTVIGAAVVVGVTFLASTASKIAVIAFENHTTSE